MNCQTEGNYIIDDMSHKLSRSNSHIFFSQNGGGGVSKSGLTTIKLPKNGWKI